MKRICIYCGTVLGHKEPYEDKSETHGMCKSCKDLFEQGSFDDDPYKLLRKKGLLPNGIT